MRFSGVAPICLGPLVLRDLRGRRGLRMRTPADDLRSFVSRSPYSRSARSSTQFLRAERRSTGGQATRCCSAKQTQRPSRPVLWRAGSWRAVARAAATRQAGGPIRPVVRSSRRSSWAATRRNNHTTQRSTATHPTSDVAGYVRAPPRMWFTLMPLKDMAGAAAAAGKKRRCFGARERPKSGTGAAAVSRLQKGFSRILPRRPPSLFADRTTAPGKQGCVDKAPATWQAWWRTPALDSGSRRAEDAMVGCCWCCCC